MHKKKLLTRLASGAVVAALAAGSAVLVSGVASADPPAGTLGSNTISPAEGSDTTRMSSMTSGPCPSQSMLADLNIVGPIEAPPTTATFPPDNPYPVTTLDFVQFSTADPFVQQFRVILRDAATERGKTIQVGEYHLTTNCYDEFGLESFGTFTAGIIFDTPTHYTVIPNGTPTVTPTPTPTPTVTPTVTPTPTPVPGAAHTLTILFGTPSFPTGANLRATVVAFSSNPVVGNVKFMEGTTVLGTAPVTNGTAQLSVPSLSRGLHSVTAVFTPTTPAGFNPSTSNTAVVFAF